MSSSVFYRFKSSKQPARVTFDGTGISVFELKKEIILSSGLGNGADFDLVLTSNEGDREYEDDTEIIPRSTTVVARRLPAARPGKGKAARYLSGKAPMNTKSLAPDPTLGPVSQGNAAPAAGLAVSESQTEAQRMEAVLQIGAEQWKRQQADMANATPVHRAGLKGRQSHVPNHPPPPFYTCHRCEKKGHWLQECPENGNPAFDDMRRVKKTLGIPRSQLKVIDKTSTVTVDGKVEDARPPPGVMVDAEGNWVVAKPDQLAWNKYQEKANKSAAAREEAERGSEELQQRGLECPVDKRLFVEPTKTPCCGRTYCKQCIIDALLDSGLQCPGCRTDGIPIDDLKPDGAIADKVAVYMQEKGVSTENTITTDAAAAGQSDRMQSDGNLSGEGAPGPQSNGRSLSPSKGQPESESSKKRKAETSPQARKAKSPNPGAHQALADTKGDTKGSKRNQSQPKGVKPPSTVDPPSQSSLNGAVPMPFMNGFSAMPTSMGPVNVGMWNPMLMPYGPLNVQWNGMANFGGGGPAMPNINYGSQNLSHTASEPASKRPGPRANVTNQQTPVAGPVASKGEESAYFRQPVNPHRQGRRNMQRPTDFREI